MGLEEDKKTNKFKNVINYWVNEYEKKEKIINPNKFTKKEKKMPIFKKLPE